MKNVYVAILCLGTIFPTLAVATSEAQTNQQQPAATWTTEQAVTCSVHDAWVLGGRSEEGFFAIVKTLTELSMQKRDLVLPDNEEVGHKFGEYIKSQAKADHDQLLYVIVDHAVHMYGTKPAATATK